MRPIKTCIAVMAAALGFSLCAGAQDQGSLKYPEFLQNFENATLRLDYIFTGNRQTQSISFIQAYRFNEEWAGRKTRLEKPLLEGNGQIKVVAKDGKVLYCNSFSTLFQEWLETEEATKLTKGYENCFQVPFPKEPVTIDIFIYDKHGGIAAELKHDIDPKDILIRPLKGTNPVMYLSSERKDPAETIDIAIVGEGYTSGLMGKFFADAQRAKEAILGHEPFKSKADQINFVAVGAQSEDAGVSIPHDNNWKNTAMQAHYDTFYSGRYLTTSSMRKVYDELAGVPFEHIIVLVNTPTYGGGGIYNNVTLSASDHPTFGIVLVHEFGHAFGGLADEYYYDEYEPMYTAEREPWEPNITTLADFDSKWADMMPKGWKKHIPSPLDKIETDNHNDVRGIWHTLTDEQKASLSRKIGLYEGGGNTSKGVYRPVQECRMKINECENFCPVCTRAIIRMIDYYTNAGE